jgi:transcriptional regulator with XRE-family HTH domain
MEKAMTTSEWQGQFGSHIKSLRLRQDLDQQALSEQAGVGLSAVKNLENGKGSTMKTLIKVLRVLGKVEWLDTLAPTVSISPMQMLKSSTERQRAFSPRKKKEQL